MRLRNKKTGEIKDVESLGHAESLRKDFGYQVTLSWNVMDNLDECRTYKTLAELNEDWEDCKPTEALIKDEKIRKAVRAWADAGGLEHFTVVNEHFNCCKIMGRKYNRVSKIEFLATIPNATHRTYTITELCGEDEECGN